MSLTNKNMNILTVLTDNEEEWRDPLLWDDMPEFVQKQKLAPYEVIIRFRDKQALDEFADKIDQPQLKGESKRGVKSTWYPRLAKGEGGTSSDLVWIIEENGDSNE